MGNDALRVNAGVFRHANLEITTHGSDWYYTVSSVMGVSFLTVIFLSFRRPVAGRLFHQISAALLLFACIAYFSMGSNLGQVPIRAEFMRPGDSQVAAAGTREIFYARYIDWFLTTPLLLLDLLLTAGMPWSTIMAAIIADEVMIVCGLIGALVSTSYKWGYWTFGMVAFFYVVYVLVVEGRRHASALGGSIKRTYFICGVLTIGLWFLYPVCWGVSEGGNVIHPDSEAVFYGVLDLLAKPVFTAILLYGHRTIDPADIGLHVREPGAPFTAREKAGYHNGHSAHHGVTNGVDGTGHGQGRDAHGANGLQAAEPETPTRAAQAV